MATESPLIHDGGQNVVSTATDARRSSITGTTLPGPNGSGQFLCVVQSTTVDRTVAIASTAPTAPTSGSNQVYGVLQNTPGPGQAADVGVLGISKVVAGSSSIVRGSLISPSSTSAGTVNNWSSGLAYSPVGTALESATVIGQVFSALIWPVSRGSS